MSKDSKKQPVHQPEVKAHELAPVDPLPSARSTPEVVGPTKGKGRFEFPDGSLYVGDWELKEGKKVKHGKGKLIVSSQTEEYGQKKEYYEGEWEHDQMHGIGFYQYKVGATYEGHWIHNKLQGLGKYTFPDGTIYEGEWQNHQINGDENNQKSKDLLKKERMKQNLQAHLFLQNSLIYLERAIKRHLKIIYYHFSQMKILNHLQKSHLQNMKKNLLKNQQSQQNSQRTTSRLIY